MNNLAATHQNLAIYTDAEKVQIQILDTTNQLLGGEHPDTITALNNLVIIYERLGQYADAEKLKIEILNVESGLLGEEHVKDIPSV